MSERKKCVFLFLGALAILSLFASTPLLAQDTDRKIIELENKVAQLEQRILKLEALIVQLQKNPAKPVAASPEKWKDKASWRSLKKGMNKGDVEQILGTPPKIVPNNYYGDIWYYPDSKGGFASFDKENLLTAWSEI